MPGVGLPQSSSGLVESRPDGSRNTIMSVRDPPDRSLDSSVSSNTGVAGMFGFCYFLSVILVP